MNKYISVFILFCLLFIMTGSVFAHPGNTDDKYGGHYIKEGNKCIGYHYHSAFEDDSKDYTGWQLNLNPTIKWSKRTQLNQFKPFNPNESTCLGEWVQVEFDEEGNVITPTPTETETETPTPTETVSPTESEVPSPTETVSPTESEVPSPTETVSPVETPDQSCTEFETELPVSEAPTATPEDELPKTGQDSSIIFYIIGMALIPCGIILIVKKIIKVN